MSTDTYTGPPREGERYADEIEWEFHMNVVGGEIPGARMAEGTPMDGDPSFDLVIPHVSRIGTGEFDETVVALADGSRICCGPDPDSDLTGGYLRLVDADGEEVIYYDKAEWIEDPVLVMGAFMNAAAGLRLELTPTA